MTIAAPYPLNLEQFLKLSDIENSPAWEFINGEVVQKPMPGGKHSRLQARLAGAINAVGSHYEAFPELRCTFGDQSIVPDLAVIRSDRIPVDENGDIISKGVEFAPEWIIEILSPEQNQMKVTRKILHSLRYGSQMGWLIDPDERVVLVYRPNSLPDELVEDSIIPCLTEIDLKLTVNQIFSWLKIGSI